MHDHYMRSSEGFLVVFDVSNVKSFQEVDNYRERINRVKDKDAVSTKKQSWPIGAPGGFVNGLRDQRTDRLTSSHDRELVHPKKHGIENFNKTEKPSSPL